MLLEGFASQRRLDTSNPEITYWGFRQFLGKLLGNAGDTVTILLSFVAITLSAGRLRSSLHRQAQTGALALASGHADNGALQSL